jgi:uncharacterized LabA/DUF88 family protein
LKASINNGRAKSTPFLFLGVTVDRAGIFIDGGYLQKILKNRFASPKIDLVTFSDELCGAQERLRTYFYDCLPFQSGVPTDEEKEIYRKKQSYFHALGLLPRFEVRQGRLARRSINFKEVERPDGSTFYLACSDADPAYDSKNVVVKFEQKGIDTLVGIDVTGLSVRRSITTVILVAGDSDFIPSIRVAKDEGMLIRLAYHDSAIHKDLLQLADDRFLLTQELIRKVTIPAKAKAAK